MANANITTGQQTVAATGAVALTTGLDISGITGDCTVHLRVQGLSAASGTPKATIAIEDSVNAFTAAQTVWTEQIQGPVASNAEVAFSRRKYQMPNARFGTAAALLRVNVTVLAGTTPSLTLDAWLEY